MDAALVSLLATFCPPLLIAYCVLWATQFIPGDNVIKTTCSVIAGLSFTLYRPVVPPSESPMAHTSARSGPADHARHPADSAERGHQLELRPGTRYRPLGRRSGGGPVGQSRGLLAGHASWPVSVIPTQFPRRAFDGRVAVRVTMRGSRCRSGTGIRSYSASQNREIRGSDRRRRWNGESTRCKSVLGFFTLAA